MGTEQAAGTPLIHYEAVCCSDCYCQFFSQLSDLRNGLKHSQVRKSMFTLHLMQQSDDHRDSKRS